MPRIAALVIFCKSDNLQSRWQLNPSAVEKIETLFCKNSDKYFANTVKDILKVVKVAQQVATKSELLGTRSQMSNWTKMACLYMRYFVANSRFVAILICTGHFFFFVTTFCCCVAYFRFLCNIFPSFLYFCSKIVNTRQK